MTDQIRKVLQRSIMMFVEVMELSDELYEQLVECGALTYDQVYFIRENSFEKHSGVRELIAKIIKGGASSYMGFLQALHATDQNDVVDLLTNGDRRFYHALTPEQN